MNNNELKIFIEQKAKSYWEERKAPYLLSSVAQDLAKEGKDYKAALGDERLLAFVRRISEGAEFKIMEHSTQKAKIGLLPKDAVFIFPEIKVPPASFERSRVKGEIRLIEFVRSLSRLSEQQLDAIVIPAKVFVDFMEEK